ncbi:hypothetical protein PROVRUST_05820 [Providencia rustigianii DSM 4541]|uniref:Uncharacterized protein n=1 Tax=Providencia rustigianii DSM 4541 TaxID=500637 RepID=D1P102_9GAMM|nr:hypothetical protein PROVRUST_05820 [Providencia rustigianii DSM 4541]
MISVNFFLQKIIGKIGGLLVPIRGYQGILDRIHYWRVKLF